MGLPLNESLDAAPFFKKHTTFFQKAYYLFTKSILSFYKKLTTFLKRGRIVVFELLLNRCWKQCIHPKIDTVVFKKTLDVFEKTFDVSKKEAQESHMGTNK